MMVHTVILCVIFVSIAINQIQRIQGEETCGRAADVLFVIDASRSIWPPHFEDQLTFVENMATSFQIGPEHTRIAAVTFSKGYHQEFLFNTYTNKTLIINAIKHITFTQGGQTDTGKALQFARTTVFKPENGARTNVPQIIIVTTDGNSTNKQLTLNEAKRAREIGILIFAIGVGKANENELNKIASTPSKDFVFMASDFRKLKNIDNRLALKACKAAITTTPLPTTTTAATTTTPRPTTTPKPATTTEEKMSGDRPPPDKECSGKNSDIIFVLDESSSIDNTDFRKQLTFVADVISLFDIGPKKSQISVIKFSDTPKVEFYLNTYKSKKQIRHAVKKIRYSGGNTYTHLALEVVRDEILSSDFGARAGVAKIVIVITDGISRMEQQTASVALEIKKQGVHMFAIGVGKHIDMTELKNIGSRPVSDYVYQVNGYNALSTIKNLLAFKTCTTEDKDQNDRLSTPCGSRSPADVMFVTDFSQAGSPEVTRALKVIGNVARGLDVGKNKVHVGLESSECPDVGSINPLQYYDGARFAKALLPRTNVRVSKLLLSARQTLTGKYSRKNSKKVIVLYTNGPIKDLKETERELKRVQHRVNNIRVIMVAGSHSGEKDILHLAMPPKDQHLVLYKDLGDGQRILNRICTAIRS